MEVQFDSSFKVSDKIEILPLAGFSRYNLNGIETKNNKLNLNSMKSKQFPRIYSPIQIYSPKRGRMVLSYWDPSQCPSHQMMMRVE